jgi:hypothetical protein
VVSGFGVPEYGDVYLSATRPGSDTLRIKPYLNTIDGLIHLHTGKGPLVTVPVTIR